MKSVSLLTGRACRAVLTVISSGTQAAMNAFNAKIPKKLREEEV